MSTQPQAAPWSAQEDLALLEGALKCGINQWKEVLLQPKFARLMKEKEQADLQARWRALVRRGSVPPNTGKEAQAKIAELIPLFEKAAQYRFPVVVDSTNLFLGYNQMEAVAEDSDEEDEELLSQSHAHLENVLFYTKNQTDIIVLSSGPPKVQMTFQRLRDYLIHKVGMLNSTALAALRRLPNLPEAERIKLLCSKTYDSLAVARCRARMSQHLFCMNPPSEQIYLPCSDPFSPEALQEAKRHFGTGPAIPASRPVARQTHQKSSSSSASKPPVLVAKWVEDIFLKWSAENLSRMPDMQQRAGLSAATSLSRPQVRKWYMQSAERVAAHVAKARDKHAKKQRRELLAKQAKQLETAQNEAKAAEPPPAQAQQVENESPSSTSIKLKLNLQQSETKESLGSKRKLEGPKNTADEKRQKTAV